MPADQTTRPQFGPGSFGCHEALHVTLLLAETVETQLCQHTAIQLVPEWRDAADKILHDLHKLYQAIGAKHL